MSGIGFPINVDVSSINAASAAVSNMGAKIEQEAKKANAEFQRMRKQIEAATKDFDNIATSTNKIWAGMGNNKNLNSAFERETARARELEKGITSLEKAYKAAYEKADTFNAHLFKGIKAAELQYAKMTAMAQAVNDVAIATQKAIAKNKVLQSDEAKELARLEGLIAARKRYNKAKYGTTDESVSLEVQAKRMDMMRDATVKLATAEAKLTAESALLQDRIRQLGTDIGKTNLIEKERIKGMEQQITYSTRLENTYQQLRNTAKSLYSGKEAEIAQQKEVNKGLEQAAVFSLKLENTYRQLTATAASLKGGMAAEIAQQKEINKGLEQAATYSIRLTNERKKLEAQNASLRNGEAATIAQLKVKNQYLEKEASYTAKLVAEQALLVAMSDPLTSALRQKNVQTQTEINLGDRVAKINAEYAYATNAITGALWKQSQATSATLAGMREEATFADRMKNKYEELRRSVDYLASAEGKRHSNLTTQEQLQKRLNDLLARSTTENRKLLAQIAALEAEERKLMGTTKGLSTSFGALQQVAAATRATLSGLGAAFGSYTSATLLVSLATFAVVRNMREMVKVGAEFEDQITRVAAISDKSAKSSESYATSLVDLKTRAIEVAASSRFMSSEVVQAMNELAMSGMNTEQIIVSVRDVMNLAMIGAIGFGEAADIATNIVMGFQLNMEQLVDVVDKMALAVTSSNQNISQLGNAMSYAAPVAAAFGVNMDAIVASTEVLANSGIKASRAGTTLRRVIVSMFTPTSKGAEAMRIMGIEASKLGAEFEDLEQLEGGIGSLVDGADGTDEYIKKLEQFYFATAGASKNIAALRDVFDIRALPGTIQLIKSLDDGTKSLQNLKAALSGAGGTAEEMMAKMADTLKNDWLVAKGAFEAIQQSIFDLTKTRLDDWLNSLVSQLQLLANNKDALRSIISGAERLASTLGSVLKVLLLVKAAMLAFAAIRIWAFITAGALGFIAGLRGVVVNTNAATVAQAELAVAGRAASGTLISGAVATGAAWGTAARSITTATGATAAMTAATGTLGATIKAIGIGGLMAGLIIPAAVIYGVYKLIDSFIGLGDVFEWLTGAAVDHTKTIEELTATYNELTAPDTGKMQKLYQEQAEYELKILELKKDQSLSQSEINEKAAEYAEIQTRINKEINAGNESIKRYAQTVLGAQIDSKRSELIEMQKLLEQTTTRGALLAGAGAIGDNPITGFLTAGALGDATKASEAYAEKINVVRMNMETLRLETVALQAEQARLLGTSRAFIESQGIKDTRIKSQIEDVTKEYEKQYEVREKIAGELDKAISANNKDEIARLQNELEAQTKLTDALSSRKSALEKLFETLQRIAKASDSSSPVQIETAEEMVKKLKSGFEQTISAVGRTQDELDALNLNATIIQAERLEEKTRAGFANLDAMLAAIKWSAENNPAAVKVQLEALSNMYATIAGYASDHAKTMDSYLKIEELARKYDEASASAYELFEHSQNLAVLKVGKDWDIEKINRAFSEQLGTILKIDEQTGQLTETSKRAATELKNGILHEMERLRGEVAILNEDGLLQSELPRMQAVLGRIQALSDMLGVLDGDLAGLVIQQMQVKENTKDVNDLYSDQAEILKLLGANTAALSLQRKAETKEVTGLSLKLKEFKFLLEDINELRDRLTETADFTSQMDEVYASMDADMISKFGTGMAEWYNPTDAIGKIDSLKSSLRDSMGATTELGQTAAQTFDDLFTQLESRLRAIVAEAKTGMTALSEQMSGLSYASVDYSSGASVAESFKRIATASTKMPMSAQEFVTTMMPYATEAASRLGQDVYTILAQSALETGYGKHLPRNADGSSSNNYFGIKAGKSWTGPVAVNVTLEDVGGSMRPESAAFRSYSSPADSYNDYARMISGGRHSAAVNASSPQEYFQSLKNSGYATDSNYVSKLMGVYNTLTGASAQVASNTKTVSDETAKLVVGTNTVSDETNKLADNTKTVSDETEILANNTEITSNAIKDHGDSLSVVESRMQEILRLESERDKLYSELNSAYKSAAADGNITADETSKLTAIHSRFASVVDELNNKRQRAQVLDKKELENQKKLRAEYQYSKEELLSMADSYGSTTTALSNYQVEYNKIIQLMQAGLLTESQAFDLLEEKALAVLSTQGDWAEYWAELKGGLQDFSELSIDVFDEFKDTLVDAIVDGKADFSDFVSFIKRKLAELAVNTIVVNVIGNITGLSGQLSGLMGGGTTASSVVGTASSLGSLSNLSSLLSLSSWKNGLSNTWGSVKNGLSWLSGGTPATKTSNIYGASGYGSSGTASVNWGNLGAGLLGGTAGYFISDSLFDGDYVGIGSTIGSAAGTAMGTTLATALSVAGPVGTAIGALVGSVAGGGLASLFGDDTPKFGGYSTSFGSTERFEDDIYSQGSFGLKFGVADARSENIDAADYQETLDGLATVSNTLADFYGSELEAMVQSSLNAQVGEYWKWGSDLDSAFQGMFTNIIGAASKAAGYGESKAHLLERAIGSLGGTAEEMTNRIQYGIDIVNSTISLFDTEVGKLMGLGVGEEFGNLNSALDAVKWYVWAFGKEGETTTETVNRLITNVNVMSLAMETLGTSLDDVGLSGAELVSIASNLATAIENAGQTMESFSTLQSDYFNLAYTEAERAQMQLDSAMRAINDWSAAIGYTGDNAINTTERLRAFVEQLDLTKTESHNLYVSAMEISSSFVSMESALETLNGTVEDSAVSIAELIDSITPEKVKQFDAFTEMDEMFSKWGTQLPKTAEELYTFISNGWISDPGVLNTIAQNLDKLELMWDGLSEIADDLVSDLEAYYDEAVDLAESRSEDLIDAMKEASDAYLSELEKEYSLKSDNVSKQIELLDDWSSVLSSVRSAMNSLQKQLESSVPDATRIRYTDMAEAAIEQYQTTGELPANISDIISGLNQVDQQDFATRQEWERAVAQNMGLLSSIQGLSGYTSEDQIDKQISLLEKELEALDETYEKNKADEEARLSALIKAEEDRLSRELSLLETHFKSLNDKIADASAAELVSLSKQTEWLKYGFTNILNNLSAGTGMPSAELTSGEYYRSSAALDEKYYLDDKLKSLQEAGITSITSANQLRDYLSEHGYTPQSHFDAYSLEEGTDPNAWFDTTQYLKNKAAALSRDQVQGNANWSVNDVIAAFKEHGFTNAYDHYKQYGWLEGLDPSNAFDQSAYLADKAARENISVEQLVDVLKKYNMDPLTHYISYGQFENLMPTSVPGFAAGGNHAGGLRLVGERGPELEYTGPSYIAPNHSLPDIFSAANAEMTQELRTMRQELAESKRIQAEQAKAMQDMLKLHNRWNGEGMPADREDYLKTMAEA